jgi:hypothetical protein
MPSPPGDTPPPPSGAPAPQTPLDGPDRARSLAIEPSPVAPLAPPVSQSASKEAPALANRRAFLAGALALSAASACEDEHTAEHPFGKGPRPLVRPPVRRVVASVDAGAASDPLKVIRAFALPLDVEPPVMFRPLLSVRGTSGNGGDH